jgi:pimeloyl-ACP methyl ester carboxylesterase
VARAPELYAAYVGVAQMVRQLESEKEAYDFMVARCREQGETGLLRRLEAAPVTLQGGVPRGYLAVRDEAMHRLGVGTMRGMRSVVTGLLLPSLQSRAYTVSEKLNTWRAKASAGVSTVWAEMLSTDLSQQVPALEVPVYLFHGVHDRTCSYALARDYFGRLRAPLKGFYSFSESAHSPVFEEREKAREILRDDVLAGVNRLAD